ncbi:PREDICTED: small cell adhesion glycoprotein [Acanthisitta chloris]|uniref:small cell adhesion glycoprotein n=1 Tax=Acanthisitta chloris TaxID=57068 RepID=UPI0004F0F41D|nr:PREDICTED: small cell adhesion glycoprotein [Acanthisitta chloris]
MEEPHSHLSSGSSLSSSPSLLPEEALTTPSLRKSHTSPGPEDTNTVVIAVVLTLVFLTLLTVLVVIGIYLYRNSGSYRTYEQPEVEAALPAEDSSREKEEYFI